MGLCRRRCELRSEGMIKSSDSRWLFLFRRFEEEVLEHILMSAAFHTRWSGRSKSGAGCHSSNVKERANAIDIVQRRWEKLGKNMAGVVTALKQVFVESSLKGVDSDTCMRDEYRKVACNEIVRAMLHRHPGSQLPDVFVSTLRNHFESLPLSYAKAGFNSEQVFMHIRLLEQAKLQQPNCPALNLQPADCMSRSSNVSEFSSTSSSPSSSVWEEEERGLADDTVDVAFACTSTVSKPALVWAFEHDSVHVRQASVYERKGVCLGVMQIQCSRDKAQQEAVRVVLKSAIKKTRFSKFAFALCGCEVPGFPFPHKSCSAVVSSSRKGTSSTLNAGSLNDSPADFKENYCSEADFNFTSTSFANHGYGWASYRGPPSPSGLFRILVSDGAALEIITGEEELGRWLLDSSALEIGEEVAAGVSGSIFKGLYKCEAVAVKEIKGCKGGSIIEGELRRDVLSIISSPHKNLVPFYGISVDSRHSSYIAVVTKYMEGGSLQALLQRTGGVSVPDLLRITRDVAEGMRFLHDHGVVHRCLRSASIMFDGSGIARVGDLGVARLWNGGSDAIPELATHHWMAPEALGADTESTSVTGKSDVYSYGMLVWELLTGQVPFADLSPVQAAVGVAIHGMRPTIPDNTFSPLKCLIEQCWASDPLDRPDFSEVLEVLDMATKELLSRDKS